MKKLIVLLLTAPMLLSCSSDSLQDIVNDNVSKDQYIELKIKIDDDKQLRLDEAPLVLNIVVDDVIVDWGDGVVENYSRPAHSNSVSNPNFMSSVSHYYRDLTKEYHVRVETSRIISFGIKQMPYQTIRDLSIRKMPHLETLIVESLPISSPIDVSLFPNLKKLSLLNTKHIGSTDINFHNSPNLEDITCHGMDVREVNLEGCINLKYIKLSGNTKLETLNFNGCSNLNWLATTNYRIENINLNGCDKVERVICYENVKSLSVHSQELTDLDCTEGIIETLDIEDCPKLSILLAAKNKINILKINKLSSLRRINLNKNQLNADALNNLMSGLPQLNNKGDLYIFGNPGANDAKIQLASDKNWVVHHETEF